jgi:hypothetical protein
MSKLERAAVEQRAHGARAEYTAVTHPYDCALCGGRMQPGDIAITVTAGRFRLVCAACAAAIYELAAEAIRVAGRVQSPRSKVQGWAFESSFDRSINA